MPSQRGFAIALAAAGLFLAACKERESEPASGASGSSQTAGSAKVVHIECFNINDCRGKSACMTPANECAGQNACKGHGWLEMTAAECAQKGGVPKPMPGT